MIDRSETICMAREAGFYDGEIGRAEDAFERFAELVRADEREACAKVFDEMANQMVADMEPSTAIFWVRSKAAEIRARGEATSRGGRHERRSQPLPKVARD